MKRPKKIVSWHAVYCLLCLQYISSILNFPVSFTHLCVFNNTFVTQVVFSSTGSEKGGFLQIPFTGVVDRFHPLLPTVFALFRHCMWTNETTFVNMH